MERSILMSDKKKDRPWDGRSRIPTQQYKENYNEIFKTKDDGQNTSPERPHTPKRSDERKEDKANDSLKKPSVSSSLQINAEIVNGNCPHCKHDTVLVSVWTNSVYRCMTCGFDVKQLVNGKISYIPHVTDPKTFRYNMKIDNPNG